jgi:Methyltransferase domain
MPKGQPAGESPLLPAQIDDFRSPQFWKQFFEARGGKSFEWYGEWQSFANNFTKLVNDRSARILILGCGNSRMSEQLYQAGYSAITNVDFDAGVIDEMKRKHAKNCPDMKWITLDVTKMKPSDQSAGKEGDGIADESFDVVLDKGTMDAMFTDDKNPAVVESIDKMLSEVHRVLVPKKGLYCIVTLAQDHLLAHWAKRMTARAAAVDGVEGDSLWSSIHVDTFARTDLTSNRCQYFLTARKGAGDSLLHLHIPQSFDDAPAAASDGKKGGKKGGAAAGSGSVVDADVDDSKWHCIHPSGEEIVSLDLRGASSLDALKEHTATLQWMFETSKASHSVNPANYFSVDVWSIPSSAASSSSSSSSFMITPAGSKPPKGLPPTAPAFPRFSITVLDVSLAPSAAVLLIPQGREHEWMFSSKEGQQQIAQSARAYGRIVFVAMGRGHVFDNSAGMKGVQSELSPIVTRFLPKELRGGAAGDSGKKGKASSAPVSVPYLAVAEDIGSREVIAQGSSALSGSWVVEDVQVDSDSDESYFTSSDEEEGETAAAAPSEAAKPTTKKSKKKDARALHRRRRLIFLSNRNAVQSEACLRLRKPIPAATTLSPFSDHLRLSFEYQQAVVSLVRLYASAADASASGASSGAGGPLRVGIIGLGSGAMVSFLASVPPHVVSSLSGGRFSHMELTAVELDPEVLSIAEKHFGFSYDIKETLPSTDGGAPSTSSSPSSPAAAPSASAGKDKNTVRVVVGDGLAFLNQRNAVKEPPFNILLIDVDAKDLSTAISFPPPAFLARPAVQSMREALLTSSDVEGDGGLLIINFCCRSPPLKKAVLGSLNKSFAPAAATTEGAAAAAGRQSGSSSSSLVLEVNLESSVPDAKNSLVAVAGSATLAARMTTEAEKRKKKAAGETESEGRASRQWHKYEKEWAPLLSSVAV